MEEKRSVKKQNFLTGAAILSVSTIIVKVIGMFYKIPLKSIIGDAGYGYFSNAYDIYSFLLVLSTTGLPVAMSRMVSEARTLNNGRQMQRIFRAALTSYLVVGILGTLAMVCFPRLLATDLMHSPQTWYSILTLGPAVLFICLTSAFRGFFQGQGDMGPTAVSQVIEAMGKLFLGLSFAWLVMRKWDDPALASGATILGITLGAGFAAVYVFARYLRNRKEVAALGGTAEPFGKTLKALLAIAIPITIGAAGLQLINLLDASTVNWRMVVAADKTTPESLNVMGRLLAIAAQDASRSAEVTLAEHATSIGKGIYSFAQTIFNLPTAFIPCITAAIIPAITSHLTLKDAKGVKMVQDSSLRLMSLIAMPCTVGLFVLAEPIMSLLGGYSGEKLQIASWLLALLAPTVLINSITTMTTAIMQAHNHMVLPVINTLIGGLAKLGVNFILVGNPDIAIIGAPVGTFVCFLVIMILNVIAMRRVLEAPPKLLPRLWKAGIAALVMGVAAYLANELLAKVISSAAVCCLGAIVAAVIIYALLVVVLKAITYEDCLLLPKGEKIAKVLRLQ